MTEGFTSQSVDTNRKLEQEGLQRVSPGEVDAYTVTAGRVIAWPLVIEKIRERPYVGYGREAMLRSGTSWFLYDTYGELFPHPHNAYLECLFDNGIVGAAIILPFYLLLLWSSLRLFLDRRSAVFMASGGVASAFVLALFFAAVGSQSFYPTEGWVGLWCAVGLAVRVKLERAKALAAIEGGPVVAEAAPAASGRFRRPGGLAAPARKPLAGGPLNPAHSFRSARAAAAAAPAVSAPPRPVEQALRPLGFVRQAVTAARAQSSPAMSIDSLLWGNA
jgi:hypothetical protein